MTGKRGEGKNDKFSSEFNFHCISGQIGPFGRQKVLKFQTVESAK